jgi:hypothetical protein
MATHEVLSRPDVTVASRSRKSADVVSCQNLPDLRVEPNYYTEGELLKTFSFIEFQLPADAIVTLQLFDSSGQEVSRLLNDALFKAGIHQVTFSPENGSLTPRLYRLSVKSEGKVFVDVKQLR